MANNAECPICGRDMKQSQLDLFGHCLQCEGEGVFIPYDTDPGNHLTCEHSWKPANTGTFSGEYNIVCIWCGEKGKIMMGRA